MVLFSGGWGSGEESVCLFFFLWESDQIWLYKCRNNSPQKRIQRHYCVCDIQSFDSELQETEAPFSSTEPLPP